MDKTVQVRDLVIGDGRPKICIPVMGSTTETLKEAAGHAMKKHPDLIEWRADYFADIENEEVRRQAFDELREILGEVPLLFTIRTRREGGAFDQFLYRLYRMRSGMKRQIWWTWKSPTAMT